MSNLRTSKLYHLQFFEAVDGLRDYYFGSIPAIYNRFSDEQIGVSLSTMKATPPRFGKPRNTRYCVVFRDVIYKTKK